MAKINIRRNTLRYCALALRSNIRLTNSHWDIIRYIREYYFKFHHLPNARMFVKAIQKEFGEEKGNSRYLHGLFPGGPVPILST